MLHSCVLALCLVAFQSPIPPEDGAAAMPTLETGYYEMYDLQFNEAHRTFHAWEQLHPADPLAVSSDAAAYLFAEFDRLGVLQSEFFTDDTQFRKNGKLVPDPVARRKFEAALDRSDQLADAVLARSPNDPNALFAKALNLGLRSDYVGLIDKKYFASLGYMKSADGWADKVLAADPKYYDAYLATGVENYMLSLNAAPVRWLLRIYGAQTDREKGLARLRVTAEKGHYLLPFARLLLAVAALRDKDKARARELLAGLAHDFPHNELYVRELSLVQ